MKKIITLITLGVLCIPTISSAEKGDIEIRFDTEKCQVVRYTCDVDTSGEKRYGWSYYTDDTGCGCSQLLSDSEIQTISKKIGNLIVAIDTIFPEANSRNILLMRIKTYLTENYKNTTRNTLFSEIILDRLYEAYGNF